MVGKTKLKANLARHWKMHRAIPDKTFTWAEIYCCKTLQVNHYFENPSG